MELIAQQGCEFYSRLLYGAGNFCPAPAVMETRYCAAHQPRTCCTDCGVAIAGTYYESEIADGRSGVSWSGDGLHPSGELIVRPLPHTAACGAPCLGGSVAMAYVQAKLPVHGRHAWGKDIVSCACVVPQ